MSSRAVAPTTPSYRPYCAVVSAVQRLAPSFVRVTLDCPEFEHFGTAGLDQRIKLVLPLEDGRISDFGQRDERVIGDGSWYQVWRELPEAQRSPVRTYTVRGVDPLARQITVDLVVHPGAGPAGAWAERAVPGDELVVVGPDERSEQSRLGIDWHPGTARRLLLVGDETAVPAVCSILESLGSDVEVDALLEVPHDGDALTLEVPEHFRISWLPREGAEHGSRLFAAAQEWCDASAELLRSAASPVPQQVRDVDVDAELLWESPEDSDGEFYAWMAGEAATVKTLRRLLVTANGVDRKRVAFMGYWRQGRSERQL